MLRELYVFIYIYTHRHIYIHTDTYIDTHTQAYIYIGTIGTIYIYISSPPESGQHTPYLRLNDLGPANCPGHNSSFETLGRWQERHRPLEGGCPPSSALRRSHSAQGAGWSEGRTLTQAPYDAPAALQNTMPGLRVLEDALGWYIFTGIVPYHRSLTIPSGSFLSGARSWMKRTNWGVEQILSFSKIVPCWREKRKWGAEGFSACRAGALPPRLPPQSGWRADWTAALQVPALYLHHACRKSAPAQAHAAPAPAPLHPLAPDTGHPAPQTRFLAAPRGSL